MLTDAAVRKAVRKAEGYYLGDGRGLWLYVSHTGGKFWRLRYTIAGRRRILSVGEYPSMGLADARDARDAARGQVRAGRDPHLTKAAARVASGAASADTFEAIAREWHGKQTPVWSARHQADVIHSLEADVFPALGAQPIRDITPPMALAVIRRIEARPAFEIAHRVRQRMSAVFVYGIATGRAVTDPAAIIQKALSPVVRTHLPASRSLDEAREVLVRTAALPAYPVTKLAMRLLALTAVRSGTLVATPWAEFDALDAAAPTWTIPAARMKLTVEGKRDGGRDHVVPLARQSVEILDALRPLTGASPYVFPNVRLFHRPLTTAALLSMVNRAGYQGRHVPHGWRSTFSTVMNECRPRDRHIIDLMLAHVPKERVEAAYNRAEHLALRREIAQAWADLLLAGMPLAVDMLLGRRK